MPPVYKCTNDPRLFKGRSRRNIVYAFSAEIREYPTGQGMPPTLFAFQGLLMNIDNPSNAQNSRRTAIEMSIILFPINLLASVFVLVFHQAGNENIDDNNSNDCSEKYAEDESKISLGEEDNSNYYHYASSNTNDYAKDLWK